MEAFTQAAVRVANYVGNDNISVTYMSVATLRKLKWTPEQLINWLSTSDIHFVVTHFHQGLDNFGRSIEELYCGLKQLINHRGFPNLKQLKCPIFTQDKLNYLRALPKEITLPTIPIYLLPDMDMDATRALVER